MAGDREIAQHLLDCFDSIYRVLGERAPTLTTDAYVVRVHEMSGAFGGVALELRGALGDAAPRPFPLLTAVLDHAVANDESGAMVLFALAMVVGPRLLVSVYDAGQVVGDATLSAALDRAAEVVVAQTVATGECARNQAPIEDASWQLAARDLTETLEAAGYGESLGITR
ncbi:MAG TPA: hypothetical protein VMV96_05600 [Acidimicrobiales bacterium]|nr:hypothetical protein [Acidimicrobiales bacterium]